MRNLKSWVFVVALLAGAFWLITAKESPKVASADASSTFSLSDIQADGELPSAEGGNAF
jgi:hypothetical protein